MKLNNIMKIFRKETDMEKLDRIAQQTNKAFDKMIEDMNKVNDRFAQIEERTEAMLRIRS